MEGVNGILQNKPQHGAGVHINAGLDFGSLSSYISAMGFSVPDPESDSRRSDSADDLVVGRPPI